MFLSAYISADCTALTDGRKGTCCCGGGVTAFPAPVCVTCDPGGENGLIEQSLIHIELEAAAAAAQSRFPIYSSIFRRTANDADDDDDEEEAITNAREYMRHEAGREGARRGTRISD